MVVSTVLFLDSGYVALMLSVVLFFATFEFLRLLASIHKAWLIAISVAVALAFFMSKSILTFEAVIVVSMIATIAWLSITLILYRYQAGIKWSDSYKIFHMANGLFLLLACVYGLLFIHTYFENGGWFLLYAMSIVWVADIGAYFSGKTLGKNKLAPHISPGKSIEGVIGGLIANAIWAFLVHQFLFQWNMSLLDFVIINLIVALLSVSGDLYESILKRQAGVKDSGTLLPGHGGVLDRIDSIIAATPVFVTALFLSGNT